jgi:hypothetical protein
MIRIYYPAYRIMAGKSANVVFEVNEKEAEWRGETKDSGVFYNLLF